MEAVSAEARKLTDIIYREPANTDKTGVSLGLNGVLPIWFSNLTTFLWAQSNVLSPSQIAHAEQICVRGGATYQVVIMPQPTREGGYGGVHYEGVIIPKDSRDGSPLAVTVALAYDESNPYARRYVMDEYGLADLRPSEVSSDLSMLFADPSVGLKLGPENIILPLRKDKWHLTIVETLGHQKARQRTPSAAETYGRVLFPAQCISRWDISAEQHAQLLLIEELHKIVIKAGELLTGTRHYPCASCGAITCAHFTAVHTGFTAGDAWKTHLDLLTLCLAGKAERAF